MSSTEKRDKKDGNIVTTDGNIVTTDGNIVTTDSIQDLHNFVNSFITLRKSTKNLLTFYSEE